MKTISKVFPKPTAHWVGDGFHVWPVLGRSAFTNEISPFLMCRHSGGFFVANRAVSGEVCVFGFATRQYRFDYGAPRKFSPTRKQLGVGQHPHRGFETVTVAIQGEIEHGDNTGNRGVIAQGDVQWMTAGRGIVHEEFHSRAFAKTGGVFEMCQIWVNLPAKHKMDPPRYQPIKRADVPLVHGAGYVVRVIAGSQQGTAGAALTFSPVTLLHVIVATESTTEQVEITLDSPASHNALLFVAKGSIVVDGQELEASRVALMRRDDATGVRFTAQPGSEVLLLGGQPLNEPIAAF